MKPYTTQSSYTTQHTTPARPSLYEQVAPPSPPPTFDNPAYLLLLKLHREVTEIRKQIAETQELVKDALDQMHNVLSALDDLAQ